MCSGEWRHLWWSLIWGRFCRSTWLAERSSVTCCCSIRICLPSTSFSSSSFRSWKFLRSRVRRAEILLFSRLQAGALALWVPPV